MCAIGPAYVIPDAHTQCRNREILGTLVLVLVVGAIFSKAVAASGPASGLGPYLVAALVWGIGLSLGGTTGYAINPARDLGPRLAHSVLPIANKGTSDWSYALLPVLGPLIGGGLAGVFLRLFAIETGRTIRIRFRGRYDGVYL